MEVKEFSKELLKKIYLERKKDLSSTYLADLLGKDLDEINEALDYLKDKNMITTNAQTLDGNYHRIILKSNGIDFAEESLKKPSYSDSFSKIIEKDRKMIERDLFSTSELISKEIEKTILMVKSIYYNFDADFFSSG